MNNDNWSKKARIYNPPLKQKYSVDGNPTEQKAAEKTLAKLVTDPEGSIYLTTPLVPELLVSLCKARYSRTELSAKQLLWREFVANKKHIPWKKIESGLNALNRMFNIEKAEQVAERILLQYGDDSVFELAGVHIFFDRVSMPATKVIEDSRIGLSPLEKSTRYVVFDQKDDSGDYSYFKDPKIMESKHRDLYLEFNKKCFEFYTEVVATLQEHLKKHIPIEKEEFDDLSDGLRKVFSKLADEKSVKAAKNAYTRSIRSKACDIARGILPATTLTNIGVFGNARALGYLLTKLSAMEISEFQMIGEEGLREARKVLPKFFDVVDNKHGLEFQEYLKKTNNELRIMNNELLKGIKPEKSEMVTLVEMSDDPEINIVAGLLYPYSNLPLQQLVSLSKKMGKTGREEVLKASLKHRKDRRHKLPRGFELAGYELVFDFLANFGAFRDLHRHRTLTQQRQQYTTEHGFDMPDEIVEVSYEKEFADLMEYIDKTNRKIAKDFPLEAQYVTALAHKMRWYFGMNLREAFWLTELRSTPQGHFHYRTIAQEMYKKAIQRYPFLKNLKFKDGHYVNMEDHSKNLERMAAMQRIERKLAEIESKYS